eukprot:5516474-Amphidinium_carterae.1
MGDGPSNTRKNWNRQMMTPRMWSWTLAVGRITAIDPKLTCCGVDIKAQKMPDNANCLGKSGSEVQAECVVQMRNKTV